MDVLGEMGSPRGACAGFATAKRGVCIGPDSAGRGLWQTVAFSAMLLAALGASYLPGLSAPLYLDSIGHLIEKTNTHLTRLTWNGLLDAMRPDFGAPSFDRPVARLTFALGHYLWGPAPEVYRIGNVVFHWGSTLALLFLFLSVLRTPRFERGALGSSGRRALAAFLGTALWSLHPVQTNAVTYAIQRMTSLGGLFYFLCIGSYLRARTAPGGWSWRWAAGAGACFFLGVLSKENVVTAVLVALLTEVFLLAPPTNRRARMGLLCLAAVFAGALAILLAVRGEALVAEVAGRYDKVGFSPWQHFLAAVLVQARYVLILCVPDHRLLVLDADAIVPAGLFHPPMVLAAVVAMAGSLALATTARRRRPLLAFGIAWFFSTQLVESALLPADLYFEHRLYVPSVFFFLGAAYGLLAGLARLGAGRLAATAVLGAVLALYATQTAARNRVWADPVAFLADNVAKAPYKAGPRINLGARLADLGAYDEAEALYREAFRIGGKDDAARYNLGVLAARRGDAEGAREWLLQVVASNGPQAWKAARLLASLSLSSEASEDAAHWLDFAIDRRPSDATLWNLQGFLETHRGNLEGGISCFERAVALAPNFAGAWSNLGGVLLQKGETRRALESFEAAAALAPDDASYAAARDRTRGLLTQRVAP